MSTSFTRAEVFTIVHARDMAAKTATDLLRFQRFYGSPSEETINAYEQELIALLKGDYVDTVTYGFKRNGKWVIAVKYRALPGGVLVADDDPGKLKPWADVRDCAFTSFLSYNSNWFSLSAADKQRFKQGLPFQRSDGTEPLPESGYWVQDLTYSSGGRAISRSVIKGY